MAITTSLHDLTLKSAVS